MTVKASLVEFRLISAILFLFPIALLSLQGGSNFLFFVLVILSLLCLCKPSNRPMRSEWDGNAIAIGLALASSVLAILISQTVHAAFRLPPYDGPVRFLLALPVYLILRQIRIQTLTVMQYGFPLGTILALLLFLMDQNSFDPDRPGSAFLNPIHFGDLALMLGFLSLFCINLERQDRPVILLLKITGCLAGIYLSLRSGSRGGWIAIPLFCVSWLFLNKHKVSLCKSLSAISLLVLLMLASYWYIDAVHVRLQVLGSDLIAFQHAQKDTSTGIRLQLWQAAVFLFKEHPFFGVGPGNFKEMMLPLSQSGMISPLAADFGRGEVHNDLLARAAEQGIVGVVSLLSLFLVPFFIFIRASQSASRIKRKAAMLGICLVTGFFVFGLTVEIFTLKMTLTFYSLTLTALLAMATSKQTVSVDHAAAQATDADFGRKQ